MLDELGLGRTVMLKAAESLWSLTRPEGNDVSTLLHEAIINAASLNDDTMTALLHGSIIDNLWPPPARAFRLWEEEEDPNLPPVAEPTPAERLALWQQMPESIHLLLPIELVKVLGPEHTFAVAGLWSDLWQSEWFVQHLVFTTLDLLVDTLYPHEQQFLLSRSPVSS